MRIIAVIALCAGLSGCVIGDTGALDRYHVDFHYSYPVDAKARIDAESFNGPIEIEGWDRNEVEITGSAYASTEEASKAIRIDVHHTRDSVEIRAVRPSILEGHVGAKFTIHVPRGAEVDRVSTSNGQIHVRAVSRATHLTTSNGAVGIADVHGEVEARTSNAGIDAESLDASAILKTSNGRIHAEKIGGSLVAETSNNSIEARLDPSPRRKTEHIERIHRPDA